MPPIRKEWPVEDGMPKWSQMALQRRRSFFLVRHRQPLGEQKEKRGTLGGGLLTWRWEVSAAIGSEPSDWQQMQTSSPLDFVTLVKGRWSMREPFVFKGGCKWCLQETFEATNENSHWDRISPRRSWPHMAQVAAARQHTSRGSVRERLEASRQSIFLVIRGWGGRLEGRGVRFSTPCRT